MPCYHPITGWRRVGGGITLGRRDAFIDLPPVTVPCGQCVGCRLERSRQWAVRCMHEAQLHEKNCFLTLTYDDAHLPRSINLETGEVGTGILPSLNPRDMTLFLKSLRKKLAKRDIKVRFFQCGEYGDKLSRPHHHVILFGYDFPDRKFFKRKMGFNYYVSKELASCWEHGQHLIGNLTFESAAYVARYCLKKVVHKMVWDDDGNKYDAKDLHYLGRYPEYVTMSRRPGIASKWFDSYHDEVYPHDRVIVRGMECKPPKYYDYLFDIRQDKEIIRRIKSNRRIAVLKKGVETPERLAVREQIRLKDIKQNVRSYEDEIIFRV